MWFLMLRRVLKQPKAHVYGGASVVLFYFCDISVGDKASSEMSRVVEKNCGELM